MGTIQFSSFVATRGVSVKVRKFGPVFKFFFVLGLGHAMFCDVTLECVDDVHDCICPPACLHASSPPN